MLKQKVKTKTAVLFIAVVTLFMAGIIAVTLYNAMQEQQKQQRRDSDPTYLLPTDPNAAPTGAFISPDSDTVTELDPFR